MNLTEYGWDPFFAERFAAYAAEGWVPARISLEHKNLYTALTERGEMPALLTGRMYYEAEGRGDLPAVGDWVAARLLDESEPKALIHAVLPRKSLLARIDPGGGMQPLAANLDTVFLVIGLDANYNPRRVERYLTAAWESGAAPVVLLTKADICPETAERVREIEARAPGVPVHAISARDGGGLEALDAHLQPGRTLALLGSSGVGKSTLLNRLLGGEIQRVQEIREDDGKGRHTTTHRQLFRLPGGALVIDTPGIRELQLGHADDGLADAFPDIDALARACRFADCRHEGEPGCRVHAALADGSLDPARFASYLKLQGELRYLARKEDIGAEQVDRQKWKKIHKAMRHFTKGDSL